MDPDANLAEQQLLRARLRADRRYQSARSREDVRQDRHRLKELVEALDGWLSRGGFPPKAWTKERP